MKVYTQIISQSSLINSVENIPIEYFKWGSYPDHFKIDMPHRHEFAELLFFTKGGGIHEIDFIDYDIEDNSIHYIPQSIIHFLKRDKSSDGFTIAFDTKYLENNNIHSIINPFKYKPIVLNLSTKKFQEIINLINTILQQIKLKESYKKKCFLLSIELLLISIAHEQENKINNKIGQKKKSSLLREFKYTVKTNIHSKSNVAWYAQQLNISPKYLGNYIKKNTGISAKKYIIESLLSSVKRSLLESNSSIKEIALDHNYSESRLCKLFKKHVGYSMKEYKHFEKVEK